MENLGFSRAELEAEPAPECVWLLPSVLVKMQPSAMNTPCLGDAKPQVCDGDELG